MIHTSNDNDNNNNDNDNNNNNDDNDNDNNEYEGMARSGLYGTFALAGRDAAKHEKAIAALRERLGVQAQDNRTSHMTYHKQTTS